MEKHEEKMRIEITSLKRQLKFYKEKLQLELTTSRKKTELSYKVSRKFPKILNDSTVSYVNNLTTEIKGKNDSVNEIHLNNTKNSDYTEENKQIISCLNEKLTSNENLNEDLKAEPEDNLNANGKYSIMKLSDKSIKNELQRNGNNIVTNKYKNMRYTSEKHDSLSIPKFKRNLIRSPHNIETIKTRSINKNSTYNLSHIERNKVHFI